MRSAAWLTSAILLVYLEGASLQRVRAQERRRTIMMGSETRTYLVHVAANVAAARQPAPRKFFQKHARR
jgi:hypothetical protein